MAMFVPRTAVVVMAKAPEAGKAKTRLAPTLGAKGAARLAAVFLRHTVEQATAAQLGPVLLSAAPAASHPLFTTCLDDPTVQGFDQGEGDLGERIVRALERGLDVAEQAIVIGTDAPALDAAHLQQAAQDLARHDAVLIPSTDGGYVLFGVSRYTPRSWRQAFIAMPWSTAEVMPRTRQALQTARLHWTEREPLADVDTPEDLKHVPAGWLMAAANAAAAS
jgi:uncharacterized protein